MEANLFIKSYKAEGNKIRDLQFYGDMEIDLGGDTATLIPTYIETRPFTENTLPYGVHVTSITVDEDSSIGYITETIKVRNDAPWGYYFIGKTKSKLVKIEVPANKSCEFEIRTRKYAYKGGSILYVFTNDEGHLKYLGNTVLTEEED